MLYQPNERELALGVGTDGAFHKAREILADINSRFALKSDGNITVREDKGRVTIYLNLGKCTCRAFRLNPWLSPRPGKQYVTHCPHTLAWEMYKRILREHYQLQRKRINPMLPDMWLRGQHHPTSTAAYFAFAEWLTDNNQQSTAILTSEACRYDQIPTGYTVLPWQG